VILNAQIMERFAAKVSPEPNTGCWLWTGYSDKHGYGVFSLAHRFTVGAHRAAWMLFRGDPGSLHVLHRCDNPACVNTDHLFLGTAGDNARDRAAKGRNGGTTGLSLPGVRGERHGLSKLSDAQAENLNRRFRAGEPSRALALEYGVTRSYVYKIARRVERSAGR
jgi:hypothetical protein